MKDILPIGPIKYKNRICRINSEGPELVNDTSFNPSPKPDPWRAKWIWLDPQEFDDLQTTSVTHDGSMPIGTRVVAYFRKVVHIDVQPNNATAWVSGDCKYRLYINGQMIGRGPAEIGGDFTYKVSPAWWFYEQYDLIDYLHQGENIITAEVMLYPEVGADYSTGHGGFIFEASIEGLNSSDGTRQTQNIKTDDSWKAILAENFLIRSIYDSRLDFPDWHKLNYKDSDWLSANILGSDIQQKWHLIPREIPHLMEIFHPAKDVQMIHIDDPTRVEYIAALLSRDTYSTKIRPGATCKLRIEFEREVAGYIQFLLNSSSGIELTWQYYEKLGGQSESEMYITREGTNCFESFRLRGFQYIDLSIDFNHAADINRPMEIFFIGMNFVSFPVSYKGKFECSDQNLNQIWKMGRFTDQLCMQNYHLDSPIHQEPLADPGDYMIEALISFYCFGEYRLARQDILRIAYLLRNNNYFMFHTSYELLWIQMIVEYFQFTNDLELIRDVIQDIDNLLERFNGYVGESGIISEAPNYMFMDWIKVDGLEYHHPPSSIGQGYITAFYYQALKNGIYLAEFLKLRHLIEKYDIRALNIATAFQQSLWDHERKLYKDGIPHLTHVAPNNWMPPDPEKIYFSRQTNILAIAYGLAPEKLQKEIILKIVKDPNLTPVQPYFMHFLFEALKKSNTFDEYGIGEIQKWIPIMHEHPSSWKESWNFGDYSHAWSGTPTIQLSTQVLGITPKKPGFSLVEIRPQLGNLSWAKGIIPTIHGDITIKWENREGIFILEIDLPPKTTGILYLPSLSFEIKKISINEKILPQNIQDGIELQAGISRINVN